MRQKFISAGIAPESIFKVYNPWTLRCEKATFPESDYYLFLGRLIDEKGTKVVVNAWNKLRALQPQKTPRLVIGGDGPLADWVKDSAAKNPAIEFRGFVSGDEKSSLLQNCRALIAPSISWEALGYVAYEAYDSGKPVLAAASGGLSELVQHGQTGFHHEPGNAEQLAHQIVEIDALPDLRKQMGAKGREWLINNTSEAVWKREFFKIVEYVAGLQT